MNKNILTQVMIAILLTSSLAFAGTQQVAQGNADQDVKLKQAFENSRNGYFLIQKNIRTGRVPSKKVDPSLQEQVSKKSSNMFNNLLVKSNDFSTAAKRWLKDKYGSLASTTRGPSSGGLYYVSTTNGVQAEYLIAFNSIGSTTDHIVWSFGDGTGYTMPYADLDTSWLGVPHIYSAAGTYTVTATQYDSSGASTANTINVVVVNNTIPYPKFTVSTNQSSNYLVANFTSQATTGGTISRYAYRFGDGSSDAKGSTLTSESHTYSAVGTYSVRFQVRDSNLGQSQATTNIYVGKNPAKGGMAPVAYFNAATLTGTAPFTAQFDATSSFSIDGNIASYQWNFGDYDALDNVSTQATPSHTYHNAGTYYASLTVTDNAGLTNTKYFPVFALGSNLASENPLIVPVPTGATRTVTFDSNDYALRSIATTDYNYIIWSFGDGSANFVGPYPTHTYAADGTYPVTLKIYDVTGVLKQVTQNVTISSTTVKPYNAFYASGSNFSTGSTVTMTTTNPASVASGTQAVWDFGDGTVISGLHSANLNPTHAYASKGLYQVTLITTDVNGISNESFIHIAVQDPSTVVASATVTPSLGKIPLPLRLDGSASTGTISNYSWAIYSAAGVQYLSGATAAATVNSSGTITAQLYIQDSLGNFSLASASALAIDPSQIPSGNHPPVGQVAVTFPNSAQPNVVNFDGTASTDPDGDSIVKYDWSVDGTYIGSYPTWQYGGTVGTHTVTLRVTDQWGAVGEATQQFDISTHTDILMSFLYGPLSPVNGDTVYFLATNAVIPGATIQKIRWDFGDGYSACCNLRAQHIYPNTGTYTAKLYLTDNLGVTHEVDRTFVVSSPTPPTAKITAHQANEAYIANDTQILTLPRFPASVHFDLNNSTSQGTIASAQWNFGDGNTGFGLTPQWTYQKPGTYTVQVTAVDSHGLSSTDSIVVQVGSQKCPDEGFTDCMSLTNSAGNVLPMSQSSWTIANNQSLSFDSTTSQTSGWITLTDNSNSSATPIAIDSSATISGGIITISQSALASLNIDMTKTYSLQVYGNVLDSSGNDVQYSGDWPIVNFGIGTLNITANESNISLVIQGTQSGYMKYLNLGSATTYTLSDLPVDTYTVTASVGASVYTYTTTITSSSAVALNIDLSSRNLAKLKQARATAIKNKSKGTHNMSAWTKMSNFGQKKLSTWKKSKMHPFDDTPQYDSCGNVAPYPNGQDRQVEDGIEWDNLFTSGDPDAQATFFPITQAYNNPVHLFCNVNSGDVQYSFIYWLTRSAYDRCGYTDPYTDETDPNWQQYLHDISEDDAPIQIYYEIKDDVTGQIVSDTISTSAAQLRAEQGMNYNNITSKIGIADRTDITFYGYRFTKDIPIPANFQNPMMRFELTSRDHNSGDNANYFIACTLDVRTDLETSTSMATAGSPSASRFALFKPMDATGNDAVSNGEKLMGDSGLFPINSDVDSSIETPSDYAANINQAQVNVMITPGDATIEQVTGVEAVFSYGSQTVTKDYLFSQDGNSLGPLINNQAQATILIDTTALDGQFTYQPGVKTISVTWKALISGAVPSAGHWATNTFTPLIDVRKMSDSASICPGGWYSTEISAFATTDMIETMRGYASTAPFRCNDFSLPWGGIFSVTSSWKHASHDTGRMADVRYFNTSIGAQDSYDQNNASSRWDDVNTYMTFSEAALAISNQGPPDVTAARYQILGYCTSNPTTAPCTAGMAITDVNFLFVLKICQMNSSVPGCPSGDYVGAVRRFSAWVTTNEAILPVIQGQFGFLMADGTLQPPIRYPDQTVDKSWQGLALDRAQWPDGTSIFQIDSNSNITGNPIVPCGGSCNLINFGINKDHFSHVHIDLDRAK